MAPYNSVIHPLLEKLQFSFLKIINFCIAYRQASMFLHGNGGCRIYILSVLHIVHRRLIRPVATH